MSEKDTRSNSNIFYFIGNTTNHALHALPLYEKLGGTFVTLSNKATKKLQKTHGVPTINVDNIPYKWHRFGYKIKPLHEYAKLSKKHAKTIEFLNSTADVVLFYDLFDLRNTPKLDGPRKVFLTHGNMLKNYMGESNRVEIFKDYDCMAALSPYLKNKFINMGIPESKLIDIGIARNDEVLEHQGDVYVSGSLRRHLGNLGSRKIVSYMPTFWGASSVHSLGLDIVKNISDNYTLLFRPHPATPKKILREYMKIIKNKPNIIYVAESLYGDISTTDILHASSAVIGDMGSIMLEAILTKKPLVFADSKDEFGHTGDKNHDSIREVVKYSERLTSKNVLNTSKIIEKSIEKSIDVNIWNSVIKNNFYYADGRSIDSIVKKLDLA